MDLSVNPSTRFGFRSGHLVREQFRWCHLALGGGADVLKVSIVNSDHTIHPLRDKALSYADFFGQLLLAANNFNCIGYGTHARTLAVLMVRSQQQCCLSSGEVGISVAYMTKRQRAKIKRPPLSAVELTQAKRLKLRLQSLPGHPTQEQIAEVYGSKGSQSVISQYVNGTIRLNFEAATRFARVINHFEPSADCQPGEIFYLGDIKPNRDAGRSMADLGPVVGTAQLGKDGLWLETGHPVGFGSGRLKNKDPNSYVLRVIGESMTPRIRSGEFVVVAPNHEFRPGDEVLVVTKDGQSMIKQLAFIRNGKVALDSVNVLHERLTFDQSEIEKIHYVSAIAKNALYSEE